MAFVPVPPTERQVSVRARDLSQRLTQVIREFEQQHPGTTSEDVRQAVRLAAEGSGVDHTRTAPQRAAIALLAGILCAGLGAFAFLQRSGGGEGPTVTWAIAGVGILVVMLGLVFAIRTRER